MMIIIELQQLHWSDDELVGQIIIVLHH